MTPDEALPYQMAALGLLIGSFLNVCILRLPAGRSVAHPASGCPRCGHMLAWWENIPVISFLALRARCRTCQTPISWQYPIVELATGLLYVGLTIQLGFGWLLYSRVILVSAMIVLFMISLRHRRLPDAIPTAGVVVGVLFSAFTAPGLAGSLFGAALGFGGALAAMLMTSRLWRPDTFTITDASMLAMVGAFLGWQAMLIVLAMAATVAAGLVVVAVPTGIVAVRFSTCLTAAAIVTAFIDRTVLHWVTGRLA